MKARILTIGMDETLVASRAAILSQSYDTDVCRAGQALEHLRAQHFDLLLVCHSIPFDQATLLIRQIHDEFPKLCIVRLLAPGSPAIPKPVAHAIVTIDFRPELWMQAVDRLLQPGQQQAFS